MNVDLLFLEFRQTVIACTPFGIAWLGYRQHKFSEKAAIRAERVRQELLVQTSVAADKVGEIHTLVDGNQSMMAERLDTANAQLVEMRAEIAKLTAEKVKLQDDAA